MSRSTGPDFGASDLYRRLGVETSASTAAIKAAYLALVRQHPPERSPEIFKRIREAYETLSHPSSRAEYDRQPDPRVAALLDQASEAMRDSRYPVAEQAYKQALIAVPELHWVRNQLGLCLLYQGEALKALEQFERLIRESAADAAVHGNAGHALRALGRHTDAEREFRTAMQVAEGDGPEYAMALVQMWIDTKQAERADQFAIEQIKGMTPGMRSWCDFMVKRAEISILLGNKGKVPLLLDQVEKGCGSPDAKQYGAIAIGRLASRLIASEAFSLARTTAMSAQRLQPDDMDYDGQVQVSTLLANNDLAGARHLLQTHVAFVPRAWLSHLVRGIEQYCADHAVFQGMSPIDYPPTLHTINGIGTSLIGQRDHDVKTGSYVATQYFTFFFLPLFPLTCYRVKPAQNGGWYFLGKVPYGQAQKVHWGAFLILLAYLVIAGSTGPDQPTSITADRNPPGASLATLPIAPVPPPLAPGTISVYQGRVTNTTMSTPDNESEFELRFTDWRHAPSGYLDIHPPLRGSGPFYLRATADSMRGASISPTGDTIFWLGERRGDSIIGDYLVVGGPSKDQQGVWHAVRQTGQRMPTDLSTRER